MNDLGYKVQIEQFEGPLDLLLHLIGRACINIEEIFVSKVTGQYLEYVSNIPNLSMDTASEFIEMAALLVYIKSRMVLPISGNEDEEEEDPEQELIVRLKTYKLFKDVSEKLKECEQNALCVYYKLPEEIAFTNEKIIFEEMSLDNLYESYLEMLGRKPDAQSERIEEVEIRSDIFTVKERTKYIMQKLNKLNGATFFSLFSNVRSRMEVTVTFIALLELINKSIVSIKQIDYYGDIFITKVSEGVKA
ncbi:MAG: segregation and condensation protein A [Christensenellales bacterium]|jgi:segregation and condensation protein A